MTDDFDIKNYNISSTTDISINLEQYLFLKGTKIEGKIILTPKIFKELTINNPKIHIKLTQFQFYSYQNIDRENKLKKISDSSKVVIKQNYIIFNFDGNKFSKKTIKPFSFFLPGIENKNFYPTFEYRKKDLYIFIRHLLAIEIPELNVIESTGVIIFNPPDINFLLEKNGNLFKDEHLNVLGFIQKGKISINIRTSKKNCYEIGEDINIKLDIDSSELKNIEIENIQIIFQKIITIKGLLINKKIETKNLYQKIYSGKEIKKNFQKIAETIKIEKIECPVFTEREIGPFIKFDENFLERDDLRMQISPSVNTELFSCVHNIKVLINFDSKLLLKQEANFPIDYYITHPNLDISNVAYLYDDKNRINELFESKIENKCIDNKENEDISQNSFVIIDKREFPNFMKKNSGSNNINEFDKDK